MDEFRISAYLYDSVTVTSTWRGEGLRDVPDEKMWRVLRTFHRCARSSSCSAKVFFCDRVDDEGDEMGENDFVLADVWVEENPYIYVLEKDFMVLFHKEDVRESIIGQLPDDHNVTYLTSNGVTL